MILDLSSKKILFKTKCCPSCNLPKSKTQTIFQFPTLLQDQNEAKKGMKILLDQIVGGI